MKPRYVVHAIGDNRAMNKYTPRMINVDGIKLERVDRIIDRTIVSILIFVGCVDVHGRCT